MNLPPESKRQMIRELFTHVLGAGVIAGFFGVVLAALLGFVDIKDPAVTAFVGTTLGYVAAEMKKIVDHYFPNEDKEENDEV